MVPGPTNVTPLVLHPEGIDDNKFISEMKNRGIVVASTLGPLKGKGFRGGHWET